MSDSSEIWLPIPGYEGHYEASSLGRIRSIKRAEPHVMSVIPASNGYLTVMICMNGKYRPHGIHRLVALAFHGEPSPGQHACHFDGDRTNNLPANLRWDSPSGNAADMRRHGRHRNARKTHCKRGHEFTPENTYLQPSRPEIRRCVTCQNESRTQLRGSRPRRKPGPKLKLSTAQAQQMVQLRNDGWAYQWIANEYGVSLSCAFTTIQRHL